MRPLQRVERLELRPVRREALVFLGALDRDRVELGRVAQVALDQALADRGPGDQGRADRAHRGHRASMARVPKKVCARVRGRMQHVPRWDRDLDRRRAKGKRGPKVIVRRDSTVDRGRIVDRGPTVDRGLTVDRGRKELRPASVDRGPTVDRGLTVDRGPTAGRDRIIVDRDRMLRRDLPLQVQRLPLRSRQFRNKQRSRPFRQRSRQRPQSRRRTS